MKRANRTKTAGFSYQTCAFVDITELDGECNIRRVDDFGVIYGAIYYEAI
jgi:hypothetical protein